ncbi:MAG: phosphatase PAP2 family protein, partial [Planctomycetes bacterium]|nr:phosphatase PAP2 family protein [Planctomycetota bacterium]
PHPAPDPGAWNWPDDAMETLDGVSGRSLGSDLRAALPTVGRDLAYTFRQPRNWLILAGEYVVSEYTDTLGLEEPTERYFNRNRVYSSGISSTVEKLGQGYVLFGAAAGWYLWADAKGYDESVNHSQRLMRSLASTGVSTLIIKSASKDDRPNGGTNAFPSGHTSMATTAAASLWYSYGYKVGIPAALLAASVAVQRLDSKAHSLDDIVGGVGLGWLIASQVAKRSSLEVMGAQVLPHVDGEGTVGITLLWSR